MRSASRRISWATATVLEPDCLRIPSLSMGVSLISTKRPISRLSSDTSARSPTRMGTPFTLRITVSRTSWTLSYSPRERTYKSLRPRCTLPPGRVEFSRLIALLMSFMVSPLASSRSRLTSTRISRLMPPQISIAPTPGICSKRRARSRSRMRVSSIMSRVDCAPITTIG